MGAYAENHIVEELVLKSDGSCFKVCLCLCCLNHKEPFGRAEAILHPDEKKYCGSLKFEKRIRSYILGRYAAKYSIGAYTGEKDLGSILIKNGVFYHPVVEYAYRESLQVSITHCENFGAAAAFPETCPIGIDIEKVCPEKGYIIEKQLTEQEMGLTAKLPYSYSKSLTVLWTAKEALSKALKTGLTVPMNVLEIYKWENASYGLALYFENFRQYYSVSMDLGEYIFSMVLPINIDLIMNGLNLEEKLNTFIRNNILYKLQ